MFRLTEKTLIIWRIRLFAVFCPLILAAAYLCLYSFLFLAAAGILLAAFLFLLCFYLPRYMAEYKIEHGEGYIHISSGVFIKTERILSSDRIISVSLRGGPLLRLLSCRSLCFFSVRFRCFLPPLPKETAEKLKNLLGGDGVARD